MSGDDELKDIYERSIDDLINNLNIIRNEIKNSVENIADKVVLKANIKNSIDKMIADKKLNSMGLSNVLNTYIDWDYREAENKLKLMRQYIECITKLKALVKDSDSGNNDDYFNPAEFAKKWSSINSDLNKDNEDENSD
jgi:ABC-type sulfate transport system substrate-binding protein